MKNPHASQLGKLAKGVPKKFSKEEIDRRRKRMAQARKKRWPKVRKREIRKGVVVYYLGRDNKAAVKAFVKGAKLAEPFEG